MSNDCHAERVPERGSPKCGDNFPDLQFDDERIAAAVGLTFHRSEAYWQGVASELAASAVAKELVPCEGAAHRCVRSYVEAGRRALADTGDRERAGVWVLNHGVRGVWHQGADPLTPRTRRARLVQLTQALAALERILERRCAYRDCLSPSSTGRASRRLRLQRSVCGHVHGNQDNGYRLRARDLLAFTMGVLERDEDLSDFRRRRPLTNPLPAAGRP